MLEWIQGFDEMVLLGMQDVLRCGLLSGFLVPLSILGDSGLLWIILSLAMLFFPRTRKTGVLALAAMLLGYICNDLIIKNIVCRPRPFVTVAELLPLVERPGSWSFPSGHSCSSFAAAAIYCRGLPYRWMKAAGLLLAVGMAFSRMYVGVHYPTDVLAGSCLGLLFAWIVWNGGQRVIKEIEARRKPGL